MSDASCTVPERPVPAAACLDHAKVPTSAAARLTIKAVFLKRARSSRAGQTEGDYNSSRQHQTNKPGIPKAVVRYDALKALIGRRHPPTADRPFAQATNKSDATPDINATVKQSHASHLSRTRTFAMATATGLVL